jgi:uncharacterized RDD family membrane protein YckC
MKTFSARETVWLQELDGIELAGFRRRAFAFMIDWALVSVLLTAAFALGALAYVGVQHLLGHPTDNFSFNTESSHITVSPGKPAAAPQKHFDFHAGLPGDRGADAHETTSQKLLDEAAHIFADVVLPVLYFGIFLWRGNGRTPGKRLMKIRVVSLVHTHMSFWHSVERALGYGAAALEGGFGFIQYFIHPYRRCAQDRLAETIVVTERSYQQRFPTSLGTPSEADSQPQEAPATADPEPSS